MKTEDLINVIAAAVARSEERMGQNLDARLSKIDDNAILKAGTSAIIQSNLSALMGRADGILLRRAKRIDTRDTPAPFVLRSLLGGSDE